MVLVALVSLIKLRDRFQNLLSLVEQMSLQHLDNLVCIPHTHAVLELLMEQLTPLMVAAMVVAALVLVAVHKVDCEVRLSTAQELEMHQSGLVAVQIQVLIQLAGLQS